MVVTGLKISLVPAVIVTVLPDSVLEYERFTSYEVSKFVGSTVLIVDSGISKIWGKNIISLTTAVFRSAATPETVDVALVFAVIETALVIAPTLNCVPWIVI